LLIQFALENATKIVQACEDGSKLNGTRQLLVCADVANSVDEDVQISEKNRKKAIMLALSR
jgi:hypothetical protein